LGRRIWRETLARSIPQEKEGGALKKWLAGKRNRKRTKDSKNLGDNTKTI
jgi:hypothetical protein